VTNKQAETYQHILNKMMSIKGYYCQNRDTQPLM